MISNSAYQRAPKPSRALRALSAVVALLLLGSACGGASDEPSGVLGFADESVTITLWTWQGTGHDILIPEFERRNPGVKVDLRVSGFDQHHQGLQAAVGTSGSVPDLAAIERAYMPQFAALDGALADLSQFGADDIAGDYLEWRWIEGLGPNGEVLGLPTDVGGLAIAYRTDLFEAAGLPSDPAEVAAMTEDWEGLMDTGRKFEEAGLDSGFFDSGASVFLSQLGQESTRYVNDDGSNALTGPALETAWGFSMEAIRDGLSAGLAQFTPEWNDAMAQGGFAVIAAPSWMRSYMASVAPETAGNWALVPVPGVGGNWGGSQLSVPADAEHPEEAFELAKFLTSADSQLELFRSNGNFPSTPELYTQPEIQELQDPFFGGQFVGPLFIDSLVTLRAQPAHRAQRKIDRVFVEAIIDVAQGADPEAVWAESLAETEAIFEAS